MYAKQLIQYLKNTLGNNLTQYQNEIDEYERDLRHNGQLERGDISFIREELSPIVDAYNEVLRNLEEAEKQVDTLTNGKPLFKEPLQSNLINSLQKLDDSINDYWNGHEYESDHNFVKDFIGHDTIHDVSMAITSAKARFGYDMIKVDDSEEAKQKRDDYVRNITCIKQSKPQILEKYSYENLSEEEKRKHDQICDYWWKNVKPNGFNASMDFLGTLETKRLSLGKESDGELAAFLDIMYTITCPTNEKGEVDYDKARFMSDGLVILHKQNSAKMGEVIQKYYDEHPVEKPDKNASKEEIDEYNKKLKDQNKEARMAGETSYEGFECLKTEQIITNFSTLTPNTIKDSDGNDLSNRILLAPHKYKAYLKLTNPQLAAKIDLCDDTKEVHFSNDDYIRVENSTKINFDKNKSGYNEAFQNYQNFKIENSAFDREYEMMDKCASLNTIYRKLLDTNNSYLGHSNSETYKNMMSSMATVENLSKDLIIKGQKPDAEQRMSLVTAIEEAEKNIYAYTLTNKGSYVHDAGETRRDLSIAALSVVNMGLATKVARETNVKLVDKGNPQISTEILQNRYGIGTRGITDKTNIDKGCEKYNITDQNLIRMMKNPQNLDDYKNMFDVKHHARIIRWNSGLYNDTKDAIASFQKYRDRVVNYMTGKTPMNEAKLQKDIRKMNEAYNQCKELLPQYCEKVMGVNYNEFGNADSRGTSAGKLRAAGAGGALDEFMGNVSGNTQRAKKQITFRDLYTKEMANNKMENNRGKHRRSAKAASVEYAKNHKRAELNNNANSLN
ncbi:hypothetical protein [Butyrivibrio sp. MB2005]|uniref:hypothetical protein n=1 Tax=Butyrivibrio sp. MB2005 TaxID=1280678 RepID=UPI00041F58AD|nr:hypothetical protein [Butyrivibrio sp. MB2005]